MCQGMIEGDRVKTVAHVARLKKSRQEKTGQDAGAADSGLGGREVERAAGRLGEK